MNTNLAPSGLVGDEIAYAYDALYRRIEADGTSNYYSKDWQVLEERDAVSGDVNVRYVWSPVYVDAMVLRDRDTDADGVVESTSAGDERLYVLQDANFNVTAVTDHTGVVQERYLYDPYGERSVLDANWAADADGISDSGFVHGHQGLRHDEQVGLIHARFRDLTRLGVWNRQDPLGYVDGSNLFAFVSSHPVSGLDPIGLTIYWPEGDWGDEQRERWEKIKEAIRNSEHPNRQQLLDMIAALEAPGASINIIRGSTNSAGPTTNPTGIGDVNEDPDHPDNHIPTDDYVPGTPSNGADVEISGEDNPDGGMDVDDNGEIIRGPRSAASILIHELSHAFDLITGAAKPPDPEKRLPDNKKDEVRAVKRANIYREIVGENLRCIYVYGRDQNGLLWWDVCEDPATRPK